jgi:hypothetical protein
MALGCNFSRVLRILGLRRWMALLLLLLLAVLCLARSLLGLTAGDRARSPPNPAACTHGPAPSAVATARVSRPASQRIPPYACFHVFGDASIIMLSTG